MLRALQECQDLVHVYKLYLHFVDFVIVYGNKNFIATDLT